MILPDGDFGLVWTWLILAGLVSLRSFDGSARCCLVPGSPVHMIGQLEPGVTGWLCQKSLIFQKASRASSRGGGRIL